MKAISRDQSHEIIGRFIRNTRWGDLDHDSLQSGVIALPEDELGRRFTAFLRNNCQLVTKGPGALIIDRTKPFDPKTFIGSGWDIVEEDETALKLTEIDFSKVRFESGLKKGESVITGEEKLKRLKRLGIRHDAKVGETLYEEQGQATLGFLYDTYGITWMELAGTVLRNSYGDRYFLYLYRNVDGSWSWDCYWLDVHRYAGNVSPVSAS